jgi:hypothetical protein
MPVHRGSRSIEIGVCVRILGRGEPRAEFADPEEMAKCSDTPLPDGTLLLFLVLRCPSASGVQADALYRETVGCVWEDGETPQSADLDRGYRGWMGALPAERLRRVAA